MTRTKSLLLPAVTALTLTVAGLLFLRPQLVAAGTTGTVPGVETPCVGGGSSPIISPSTQPTRVYHIPFVQHISGFESLYIASLLTPYVPISGQYYTDKNGGQIFVPVGAQPDPGLTCPGASPSPSASPQSSASPSPAASPSPSASSGPSASPRPSPSTP